jgi:hypothetical protein
MPGLRTLSPSAAARDAISTVIALANFFKCPIKENFAVTGANEVHQLTITVPTVTLQVEMRLNAVYMNSAVSQINIPKYADVLDLLAVVIPAEAGAGIRNSQVLFLPKWVFRGRKVLYISDKMKAKWGNGATSLASIAAIEARDDIVEQNAIVERLTAKPPSKKLMKSVVAQNKAALSGMVQQLIDFQASDDIVDVPAFN